MGNSTVCKAKPCSQPKPIHENIITKIFKITIEKSTEQTPKDQNGIDMDRLINHVKDNSKALIEYLETNHKKLVECGYNLKMRCSSSLSPEVHAISLLVIIELTHESKKFTNDKEFKERLQSENKAIQPSRNDSTSFVAEGNGSLKDNLIEFEQHAVDCLSYVIEQEYDDKKVQEQIYDLCLKAVKSYLENHIGSVLEDQMIKIMKVLIEKSAPYKDISMKENLDKMVLLFGCMKHTFSIAQKLSRSKINYLKFIQNIISENYKAFNDENENLQSQGSNEFTKLLQDVLKDELQKLIKLYAQNIYDLEQFSELVNPLLQICDENNWKSSLFNNLFADIMTGQNRQTGFDSLDLKLISKLLTYIASPEAQNNFKSNSDLRVKKTVLNLLADLLAQCSIKMLEPSTISQMCFRINLLIDDQRMLVEKDTSLIQAIHHCFSEILNKLCIKTDNKIEMLNVCSLELARTYQSKAGPGQINFDERVKLIQLIIENLNLNPNSVKIPNLAVQQLLRTTSPSVHQNVLIYATVEKLFWAELQGQSGSILKNKALDVFECSPETAYITLVSRLNILSLLVEDISNEQSQNSEQDLQNVFYVAKHISLLARSIVARNKTPLTRIVILFMKSIRDLMSQDKISALASNICSMIIFLILKSVIDAFSIKNISLNSLEKLLEPIKENTYLSKLNEPSKEIATKNIQIWIQKASVEVQSTECIDDLISQITDQLIKSKKVENQQIKEEDFRDLAQNYYPNMGLTSDESVNSDIQKSIQIPDGSGDFLLVSGKRKKGDILSASMVSIGQVNSPSRNGSLVGGALEKSRQSIGGLADQFNKEMETMGKGNAYKNLLNIIDQ